VIERSAARADRLVQRFKMEGARVDTFLEMEEAR
jgi:hypothetical protein